MMRQTGEDIYRNLELCVINMFLLHALAKLKCLAKKLLCKPIRRIAHTDTRYFYSPDFILVVPRAVNSR